MAARVRDMLRNRLHRSCICLRMEKSHFGCPRTCPLSILVLACSLYMCTEIIEYKFITVLSAKPALPWKKGSTPSLFLQVWLQLIPRPQETMGERQRRLCRCSFGPSPLPTPYSDETSHLTSHPHTTLVTRVHTRTHRPSRTTLNQQVSTSTVVEMEGAVHAQTSNAWKTDQYALGWHGVMVQT